MFLFVSISFLDGAISQYQGCFTYDSSNPVFSYAAGISSSMTASQCVTECSTFQYRYAGVNIAQVM